MSRSKLYIIILWTTVWWLAGGRVQAQEFTVTNFRPLPNDISAYIKPVRDLNDEACALLKVVAPEEFAFSTPLGIVERHSEVGEIWLYVPNGTRLLTIKHPLWGVLRDYRFPQVLESRMTYELVISPPLSVRQEQRLQVRRRPSKVSTRDFLAPPAPVDLPVGKQKPRDALRWECVAALTVSAAKDWVIPGLRLALVRRHGFYVFGQANLKSLPATATQCDANGYLPSEGYTPYYTDQTPASVYLFTAGAMHRLSSRLYCYEGAGYGRLTQAWQTTDGLWVRNASLSVSGWAAEAGAVYRMGHFHVQAGVQTLAGKKWSGLAGVGVCF